MKQPFHLIGRYVATPLSESNSDSLSHYLSQLGVQIPLSVCSGDDLLISVDVKSRAELREAFRTHIGRSVLVRNEPEIVCPDNFNRTITRRFDLIIDVGRPSSGGSWSTVWPQSWPSKLTGPAAHSRLERVVVINAYKFSLIKGQRYGLRAMICSRNGYVDVYGPGWAKGSLEKFSLFAKEFVLAVLAGRLPDLRLSKDLRFKPLNYMGPAHNKLETLSKYKVSLVIENDPGFLSEKLFDCLFAGTIPVYVGNVLGAFPIPQGLVVSAGASQQEVDAAIARALAMDYIAWRKAVDGWLGKQSTRDLWDSNFALARISERIFSA